jgi:hypothetical protein
MHGRPLSLAGCLNIVWNLACRGWKPVCVLEKPIVSSLQEMPLSGWVEDLLGLLKPGEKRICRWGRVAFQTVATRNHTNIFENIYIAIYL